jgi:hypothetical protein
MNCRRVQPLLLDFSSGRLEARAVGEVSAHLIECAGCRRTLEHELRTAALLNSMTRVAPRVDAWPAIETALHVARPAEASRLRTWRPMVWAGGLAATSALVVSLMSPALQTSPPPPEPESFRSFGPAAAAGLGQESTADPLIAAQNRVDQLLDRVASERR